MRASTQREVDSRLKSIAGHLRGVSRMNARGAGCGPMLIQILAVQGALDGVAGLLIDEHIELCLSMAEDGKGRGNFENAVRELEQLYELSRVGPSRGSPDGELEEIDRVVEE